MVSPYIFGGIGALMFDAPKATLVHDFRRDADGVALARLMKWILQPLLIIH
jgi:hypothetical protein